MEVAWLKAGDGCIFVPAASLHALMPTCPFVAILH